MIAFWIEGVSKALNSFVFNSCFSFAMPLGYLYLRSYFLNKMLNRRHLRVKAFQAIYAWFQKENEEIGKIEKEVLKSCLRSQELYLYMISIYVEILHQARLQIEKNKSKRLPSEEDLNPNMKFVQNLILNKLEENEVLRLQLETKKINWSTEQELMRKFYRTLVTSDFYQEYMQKEGENSFEEDKELAIKIFEEVITPYEPLHTLLEEKYVYWYDDLTFVNKKILKNLESFRPSSEDHFIVPESAFKDDSDIDFLKVLIRKTVSEHKDYEELIKEKAKNWDYDRIALNDRILLMMGVCEFIHFPSIPVKVTMNEYLDLAKVYSTEKSNQFINGILDRILAQLKEEDKVKKSGRGLLG